MYNIHEFVISIEKSAHKEGTFNYILNDLTIGERTEI